jgi:hypothetical protein
VGNTDQLPQMDMSYSCGKGYDPIDELMRAIILKAIDDVNSSGENHAEAIEYLNSEEEEYIFSFIAICRHFGIDPAKTRGCIMAPTHRISTRRRAA